MDFLNKLLNPIYMVMMHDYGSLNLLQVNLALEIYQFV